MCSDTLRISKTAEEYIGNLKAFNRRLESIGTVDARLGGHEYGSFIYIKGVLNSAEVMEDDSGVWVEFWKVGADEPNHDKSFLTYDDAYVAIDAWIGKEN